MIKSPSIDGLISDSVWKASTVADSFLQYLLARGQPSSAKSRAQLLYDAENIYVAFYVGDPEPPVQHIQAAVAQDAKEPGTESIQLSTS